MDWPGGVRVPPPVPMDLIHHFFEIQRSKFSQRIAITQNEAPSTETQEMVKEDKEALRNSVLRRLQSLAMKKAEGEAAHARSSTNGDCGDGEDVERDKDDFDGDNGNSGVGCNHWNEVNAETRPEDGSQKPWRHNGDAEGIDYPVRADAEDCAYYMKSGSCKYGSLCKFNHPHSVQDQVFERRPRHRADNSQKSGQAQWKHYFTSGQCKQISEMNSIGLPLRPGEIECAYYIRTGSCKYGENCRFHHPEPTKQDGGKAFGPSSSRSWSSSRVSDESSQFLTSQGSNSEWNNQTANAKSESGLPIPPALSMNGGLQQGHNTSFEEYHQRPRQPECAVFVKTGDCKYKSNCKYHHPKGLAYKPKQGPA